MKRIMWLYCSMLLLGFWKNRMDFGAKRTYLLLQKIVRYHHSLYKPKFKLINKGIASDLEKTCIIQQRYDVIWAACKKQVFSWTDHNKYIYLWIKKCAEKTFCFQSGLKILCRETFNKYIYLIQKNWGTRHWLRYNDK